MVKALRFWIEFAKHCINGWDTISSDMGYTPFSDRKTKNKVNTEVKK
jgi:hypothetical protein